jgi:hypothetical protein
MFSRTSGVIGKLAAADSSRFMRTCRQCVRPGRPPPCFYRLRKAERFFGFFTANIRNRKSQRGGTHASEEGKWWTTLFRSTTGHTNPEFFIRHKTKQQPPLSNSNTLPPTRPQRYGKGSRTAYPANRIADHAKPKLALLVRKIIWLHHNKSTPIDATRSNPPARKGRPPPA